MDQAEPVALPGGSVEKAFALVGELAVSGAPQRLGDLAAKLGMTKPTAHRLLRSLTAMGYTKPLGGGLYSVGPALVGIAAATLGAVKERPLVRRTLEELHARTGLTASFAIQSGDAAVVVDSVEPDQAYRVSPRLGVPVRLTECAAGRAMLAAAAGNEVPTGYVYDDTEPVRSLAAAVRHHRGVVAGALLVTGLSFTVNAESVEVLGPLIVEQAGVLSATLQAMLPAETVEGIA
ncbi:helix-turn-helix domain-containing protein [Haloactinopolyspora sp.]|uniref:IclR family transcriptional regulator n=1 Tax=Haloactinopolyspora sp. TaxID=1966353 RepID=UPI00262EC929|nr:helix-turn-helix domain-containing protein [Haloactinopolyspora sp.]